MFKRTLPSLAVFALAPAAYAAETQVPFAYAWSYLGPTAPFFVASDNGHFANAGIELDMHTGNGSVGTVEQVASGTHPLGFADINALIDYHSQNPEAPVKAVMMLFDRPAYGVLGLKSLGVSEPEDVVGRTVGIPPSDAAGAQFPVFANVNDIQIDSVTVEPVTFSEREQLLANGDVDAITGFTSTSYFNLLGLGVPEEDISVVSMADHGLDLYGNAIIVNTDFADANPETVEGFLHAFSEGLRDTIDAPIAAVESVFARNPDIDPELEQKRLDYVLNNYILTDFTRENGVGGIDHDRFARAVEQLQVANINIEDTNPETYFTDSYMPNGPVMITITQ
ncbi:MAG: ABC transporter substrate-binding protein [Pseudomonadota bacterium]